MNEIVKFIAENGGYAKMSELRLKGFHPRDIRKLVDERIIEKVKSGLYKIRNSIVHGEINPGFIDICRANPKAVICLISALAYHELSTINPPQIYAALPKTEKPSKILYPPVKFYYWEKSIYGIGIIQINTNSGIVKVYDKEKTVCDIFRYRDKLGEDIAFEALKNYLSLKESDLNKLRNYSEKLRIKTVLQPYIKAIVG